MMVGMEESRFKKKETVRDMNIIKTLLGPNAVKCTSQSPGSQAQEKSLAKGKQKEMVAG